MCKCMGNALLDETLLLLTLKLNSSDLGELLIADVRCLRTQVMVILQVM
jgi:hypothetical protein